MKAIIVVGVVFLFGFLMSFFASVLNRKGIKSLEIAENVIRNNLVGKTDRRNLDAFLNDILPSENIQQGKLLLSKIAEAIGIPVESLLFDGKLNDSLVAHNISVPQGKGVSIDPFAYEINHILEKHIDWKSFERKINSIQITFPCEEDAFCDFFMGLTMREFVSLFAPFVKM